MVPVARDVRLFGRRASVMRHDQLALLQEVIGHGDAFVQQSAGIVAQVEHQALNIVFAQAPQIVVQFRAVVSSKLMILM